MLKIGRSILAGKFSTDIEIVVFDKPCNGFHEVIGRGTKAGLLVLSNAIGISDTDTDINPSFVDITRKQ